MDFIYTIANFGVEWEDILRWANDARKFSRSFDFRRHYDSEMLLGACFAVILVFWVLPYSMWFLISALW